MKRLTQRSAFALCMTPVLAMGIVLGSSATGCGGGSRVFAGPDVAGDGVRCHLKEAEAETGEAFVGLTCFNDTDFPVAVNRNQVAVVTPDGNSWYRRGGREIHWIKPHGDHAVHIKVEDPAESLKFHEAPGLWVRFDGVWSGGSNVRVPPMKLGQPQHDPGSPTASFQPPPEQGGPRVAQNDDRSRVGKAWDAMTGSDSGDSPPPSSGGGLQSYRGPRRRLKEEGTKCAAMPLKASDVADNVAFIVDELLLTELQKAGFEAIGPEDINAILGFENIKDAAGCDDASCVAEIGNALGVPYLAAGNIALVEGSTVITLKLFDVRNTRVVARVSRIAEGGIKVMPRVMGEAVQDLVKQSKL